jgi:hypothetical protein
MASRFESKNAVLTKKLNDVVYELLVKSSSDMIYVDSETTLTEILSDIGDALTSYNRTFTEVMADINSLVRSDDSTRETLREIWSYINVDGDPKSALIQMIESKVTAEEGKGLSTCDFTDVLKEKLLNDYTKAELDEKFTIVMNKINEVAPSGLVQRITDLENKSNMVVTTNDEAQSVTSLPNGSVWFKIISNA